MWWTHSRAFFSWHNGIFSFHNTAFIHERWARKACFGIRIIQRAWKINCGREGIDFRKNFSTQWNKRKSVLYDIVQLLLYLIGYATTVQFSAVMYTLVQYCTIQYCTVHFSTVHFSIKIVTRITYERKECILSSLVSNAFRWQKFKEEIRKK